MKLGDLLRKWRRASDFNLQEASARIGISVATLSRIERGYAMNGDVLAKVLVWLLGSA